MPGGVFALVDNISPDERNLTAAYNDFEKVRELSHGRCLSLAEWTELLGRVRLIIEHSEYMDQGIEFGPWVQRMRCADSTVARLKAMLADEPLASLLRPREMEAGLIFTLQEAIVVTRRPA